MCDIIKIMAADFEIVSTENGRTMMMFAGDIVEGTILPRPPEETTHLVLNLEGVRRLNSVGTALWLAYVVELESKGIEIQFEKIPTSVTTQIRLIANFLGNGHVKSFFVPYFCDKCDIDFTKLSEKGEVIAEKVPCESCDREAIVDEDPRVFTLFH